MSIHLARRGPLSHTHNHHHLNSLLSTGFNEEVTDRYEDVDVTLVFPVLGPHRQPEYNGIVFFFITYSSLT